MTSFGTRLLGKENLLILCCTHEQIKLTYQGKRARLLRSLCELPLCRGKNPFSFHITHRFRMWLKVWRGWRSFLILKKIKKTKLNLAKQKGKKRLLLRQRYGRSFVYWTLYIYILRFGLSLHPEDTKLKLLELLKFKLKQKFTDIFCSQLIVYFSQNPLQVGKIMLANGEAKSSSFFKLERKGKSWLKGNIYNYCTHWRKITSWRTLWRKLRIDGLQLPVCEKYKENFDVSSN
jgi:hypothetical protein